MSEKDEIQVSSEQLATDLIMGELELQGAGVLSDGEEFEKIVLGAIERVVSRKLEEARGRIGELTIEADRHVEEITNLRNVQDEEMESLAVDLDKARARIAELEAALEHARIVVSRASVEHINIQPDWSNGVAWSIDTDAGFIRYAKATFDKIIATLEGKSPNAETIAAMEEARAGGGEKFATVDDLMKDLNSDG